MTISRLELTNFTVFKKASFEFCSGINVLIGENGTGKSHVLKAMYAFLRTSQEAGPRQASSVIFKKVAAVFHVGSHGRLIAHGASKGAELRVVDSSGKEAQLGITGDGADLSWASYALTMQPSIFVPPREVLAMYRGFVAAYEGRELDFDETYYDLCKALSAAPLRGERFKAVEAMLVPLEQILGGKVVLEGDRFFVRRADGETEAHLVAEGLRKIASLAYLVANGSLTRDSVLFWDEPEASLNPGLVVKVVDFLRTLAVSGVQIFLASHDFLLVHRLSQAVEYKVEPGVPIRFFSLYRPELGAPVEVERGDTLIDIEHNAILDEFARYYDREQVLAAGAMRGDAPGSVTVEPARSSARKKTAKAKPRAKKQPAKLSAPKPPASRAKKTAGRKTTKMVARG